MFDELAPAVSGAAVENDVNAADVERQDPTEKGQPVNELCDILTSLFRQPAAVWSNVFTLRRLL